MATGRESMFRIQTIATAREPKKGARLGARAWIHQAEAQREHNGGPQSGSTVQDHNGRQQPGVQSEKPWHLGAQSGNTWRVHEPGAQRGNPVVATQGYPLGTMKWSRVRQRRLATTNESTKREHHGSQNNAGSELRATSRELKTRRQLGLLEILFRRVHKCCGPATGSYRLYQRACQWHTDERCQRNRLHRGGLWV